MRLARLAAVGLAIGVIAGFAIALLRPRPTTPTITLPGTPGTPRDLASTGSVGSPAEDQLWDQFRKAEESPVVELRSHRRVTG
jgi:hypothetical protein